MQECRGARRRRRGTASGIHLASSKSILSLRFECFYRFACVGLCLPDQTRKAHSKPCKYGSRNVFNAKHSKNAYGIAKLDAVPTIIQSVFSRKTYRLHRFRIYCVRIAKPTLSNCPSNDPAHLYLHHMHEPHSRTAARNTHSRLITAIYTRASILTDTRNM